MTWLLDVFGAGEWAEDGLYIYVFWGAGVRFVIHVLVQSVFPFDSRFIYVHQEQSRSGFFHCILSITLDLVLDRDIYGNLPCHSVTSSCGDVRATTLSVFHKGRMCCPGRPSDLGRPSRTLVRLKIRIRWPTFLAQTRWTRKSNERRTRRWRPPWSLHRELMYICDMN